MWNNYRNNLVLKSGIELFRPFLIFHFRNIRVVFGGSPCLWLIFKDLKIIQLFNLPILIFNNSPTVCLILGSFWCFSMSQGFELPVGPVRSQILGFTGHTESGAFPPLPTAMVEVNSGDRTLWEMLISVRAIEQVMGKTTNGSLDHIFNMIRHWPGFLLCGLSEASATEANRASGLTNTVLYAAVVPALTAAKLRWAAAYSYITK